MTDWRRIKRSRLPVNYPVTGTIAMYLLLRVTRAPEWLWGVMGVLFAAAWVSSVIVSIKEKHVDPLDPPR